MRRALLLLCTPILVSCSDDSPTSTDPENFSGTYVLETINGQSLPFIDLLAPLTGDTLYINGGDLSVLSNGRVRLVFERQWRPRNQPPQPVTTDSIIREYRVDGDFVYIDYQTGGLQGAYTDTVEVYESAVAMRQLVNRHNQGHFWRNVYFIRP